MKLNGKTALITGATSGIGLATAELFVREGARVIITGRDAKRLEQARAVLGGTTLAVQADVRSVRDLQRAAQQIEEAVGKGGLDIFFANAGIAYSTPLQLTDEESFEELFDTNVKGLFFSMQSVLPLLRDGASVILNSAWLNTVGMPGFSALAATKSAVRSFARSWSAELLKQKIRVNVVSPGAIDTPIFELEGLDASELEGTKRQLAANIPAGRLGSANEIADAVLFLASDDSRYMLGSEIVVDGGFSQL